MRFCADPSSTRATELLEPFGPNVVSTDGDLWRFHIRTTLPAVGEGVQRLAWDETRRQAEMLRRSWLSAGASDVRENMYQLSMNIACHVIFNQRVDWPRQQGSDTTSPPLSHGHKMSLLEALSKLVLQLPFIILLPVWFLRLLPIEAARTASQAYLEVDRYMDELLAAEKTLLDQGPKNQEGRRDNLATALLGSNDPLVGENAPKVDCLTRFTMKDIKGNMFVFLLAGMFAGTSPPHTMSWKELTCVAQAMRQQPTHSSIVASYWHCTQRFKRERTRRLTPFMRS